MESLTMRPGSLEEKQSRNITEPPPYFKFGIRFFLFYVFLYLFIYFNCILFLYTSNSTRVFIAKRSIFVQSDRRILFQSIVGVFSGIPYNNLLAWRWRLLVVPETCNSPCVFFVSHHTSYCMWEQNKLASSSG